MKKRGTLLVVILISLFLVLAVSMPSLAAKKIIWRGQSSYSAGLPQLFSPAAHFAEVVEKLTDGQLVVKMSPGGAIVPALKVFDAVSAGTLDIGCTWAGWWIGKFPAAVLFANSYPNGLQTQEMLGWLYAGGGMELWNELYKDYNIVVLPPYGMLGSENFCWSNKPINTLEDFKGLKFRTVGIWGKCLEKLGARVVTLPGAEVYPSLERGVIDACEFGTPAIDIKFGFQEICNYLKLPGIHEPCAPLETLVNKKSWDKLPDDLKYKVQVALRDTCFWAMNQALKEDAEAMEFFLNYKGLNVSKLTPEMINEIIKVGNTVLAEEAAKDPMFDKILKSQIAFRKKVEPYADLVRLPYPYAGK